jgi:hypothetical protein
MKDDQKQYSEHFINFVIKGKEFDFDAFKTQEEFDKYEEELIQYIKESVFEYLKIYFENVESAYRESKLSDPFAMKDIIEQGGFDLGDYDKAVQEKIETYFMQKDINEIMKS